MILLQNPALASRFDDILSIENGPGDGRGCLPSLPEGNHAKLRRSFDSVRFRLEASGRRSCDWGTGRTPVPARPCKEQSSALGPFATGAGEKKTVIREPSGASRAQPINALCPDGLTALHRAVRRNDKQAVAALASNAYIELNTVVTGAPLRLLENPVAAGAFLQGNTPLSEGVANRSHEIVKLLIDAAGRRHSHPPGFDPGGRLGRPVLDAANYDGRPRINPEIPDLQGLTPLLIAAKNNDFRMVDLLLSIDGIDRNCRDHHGCRPLHYAALAGNKPMMRALLRADGCPADVNAQSSTGETALTITARGNDEEAVALLLRVPGIDHRHKAQIGQDGMDAESIARYFGRHRIADSIRNVERANQCRQRFSQPPAGAPAIAPHLAMTQRNRPSVSSAGDDVAMTEGPFELDA